MLDDQTNSNSPPSGGPPSSLPPSSTSPSTPPLWRPVGPQPSNEEESAPRQQGLIARAFGLQPEEIRKMKRYKTEQTNREIKQYEKQMKKYEEKAEKEWEKQKDQILYGAEGYNLGRLEDRVKWLKSHGHGDAASSLENHIDRVKRRLGHKFDQIEKRQERAFRHSRRDTIKGMRAGRDMSIAEESEAIRKGWVPPKQSRKGFWQGLVGGSSKGSGKGEGKSFLRSLFG